MRSTILIFAVAFVLQARLTDLAAAHSDNLVDTLINNLFAQENRRRYRSSKVNLGDESADLWNHLPDEVKEQVAAAPGRQLQAMCDHGSKSCRLSAVAASNADSPVQSIQCAAARRLSAEMPKHYEAADVERRLYEWWESSGYFQPAESSEKQCFIISMPPPNVTGKLHMGHAMFVALQDIMVRFHRMRGHPTLWLPGTDHAGIATQMLVERALNATGIKRQEIGREAFLEHVWKWKEKHGGFITDQIRRLGASCDWPREKFTLEPHMCRAVAEAFVLLYERGLIYRGEYMVNWSPALGTAISDLEVDHVEELGSLYYFKYRLADSGQDDYIPVATTRPETILGDQAVCVHPQDDRYKHLVGKEVLVPILDRRVPVIADDYVKMDFGSGAVKITPAHDPNDFAIGKRHALPIQNILNKDATINEEGGPYKGLDRFACRKQLWADMAQINLTIRVVNHMQKVPRSERSGEVVEPLVSKQWFVKMDGLAKKGQDVVRNGDIKIIPKRFEKTWFHWLENPPDWCISRQLWWGHRIPVWYVEGQPGKFYVARSYEEAQKRASDELGPGVTLIQDEDVLDTWFSSGLWPFATVGWPAAEGAMLDEFKRFYPSSVMETGYDILFFWVARMVMLGLEFTGKPPFHTIYLHGLVRDANNQKMSKTKGNVINPIETIETYGTDALRLTLVTGVTPGADVPLAMELLTLNRNFADKLWNTGRFILTTGFSDVPLEERSNFAVRKPFTSEELAMLSLPERWIISRCHRLIASVTSMLATYDVGKAGEEIFRFLWDEYADWYIEIAKRRFLRCNESEAERVASFNARRTLVYTLDSCLRLLHPFMPFVTEELWQKLPHEGPSLMLAHWPQHDEVELPVDEEAITHFVSFQRLVESFRRARQEHDVAAKKKIKATIFASDALHDFLWKEADPLAHLARIDLESLEFAPWTPAVVGESGNSTVQLIVESGLVACLPLADLVDKEKERKRLAKEESVLAKRVKALTAKFVSNFTRKAAPDVVKKFEIDLAEQTEKLKAVRLALSKLIA